MKAAVPRCRMRTGASLKSSTVRHGFPAIRPVTGMSIGHGPGRCARRGRQSLAGDDLADLAAGCASDAADVEYGRRGLAVDHDRRQGILPGGSWGGGMPAGRPARRAWTCWRGPRSVRRCRSAHAGEDVPGQVINHAHRPGEQRPYGLLGKRLGHVLPAGGRCGRQVVINAKLFPRRPPDAIWAGAELVESPQPRQRDQALQDWPPVVARVAKVLAVVVQDAGVALGEAAGFPFPRAILRTASTALSCC